MLNVARELRWVDLSLDHWDDIAPMRCAIPVERGSGAMATAIKVGDRFLQPWEYEVECMISALPYTVSGEKDRVRLSMRMVDWKTDEVTSVCWIRLVDGGTWFNDRGHYHISALVRSVDCRGIRMGFFALRDALICIKSNALRNKRSPLVTAYSDYRDERTVELFRKMGFTTEYEAGLYAGKYRLFTINLDESPIPDDLEDL